MTQRQALVVDDNPQNVKVLTQMLMRQGVKVTQVMNSTTLPSYIPILRNMDVIFMDLEMPGLDGYKAKDLIRSHFEEACIIAYTVYVGQINVVRCVGFDGFLGKPLDSQRFPQQLNRILSGEKVWERS